MRGDTRSGLACGLICQQPRAMLEFQPDCLRIRCVRNLEFFREFPGQKVSWRWDACSKLFGAGGGRTDDQKRRELCANHYQLEPTSQQSLVLVLLGQAALRECAQPKTC